MGTALLVLFYTLSGAAALAVNYAIWFVLLPMLYRMNRDTVRRTRARRNSN